MASKRETVLVFGATGAQGGSTARALVADGWRVRALTRDTGSPRAKELAALGVTLVQGDFRDRSSLERAMQGVYGVFSMQPSSPGLTVTDDEERNFGILLADLALAAGVRHFVYSSVSGLTGGTGVSHFETKWQIEEHVRASKLPATIVRPASFFELLLEPWVGLQDGHFFFFLRPDQEGQFIAVEDIGKIVARVFAAPQVHLGQTLEMAGDTRTGDELARAISDATGAKIAYARFPPEVGEQVPMIKTLVAMIDPMERMGAADVTALRREVPGLLTVEAWLARTGAAAIRKLRTSQG